MPVKLMESEYLKYFIIQIASGHFGWNRIVKALPKMKVDPAGILIKIGQGAKPGDGGLLPAAKVAEHIQAIRGVPKADLLSPPNHQGLYSIEESVQKMFMSMNAAFKFRVPVAIKCAASATSAVARPEARTAAAKRSSQVREAAAISASTAFRSGSRCSPGSKPMVKWTRASGLPEKLG